MSGIEAGGDVVEVVLWWGGAGDGSVLSTKYLRAGERFEVGEAEGCDAVVPVETLGEARAEVVVCERGGTRRPSAARGAGVGGRGPGRWRGAGGRSRSAPWGRGG